MAELLKPTDTLAQGYPKINVAIEQAEQALTTSDNAMDTANSSMAASNQALANSQSTQDQLNQVIVEGDSSVEAAQARVNADNSITYDTLKERLDAEHQELNSQLAHITINVKQFGAKGDNTTIDDLAFNDAINSLVDKGGKVIIPAGIYLLNSPLNVPENVSIIGSGSKSTILKFINNTDGLVLTDYIDHSGTVIKDIHIQGTRYTLTKGINLPNTNYAEFDNVTVAGFGYGFHLNKAVLNHFNNVYVINCDDGFHAIGGSYANKIIGGTITACTRGISGGTATLKIFGLDIEACTEYSIGGVGKIAAFGMHLEGHGTSDTAIMLSANLEYEFYSTFITAFVSGFKQSDANLNGKLVLNNTTFVGCTTDINLPTYSTYYINGVKYLDALGGAKAGVVNLNANTGILIDMVYQSGAPYDLTLVNGGINAKKVKQNGNALFSVKKTGTVTLDFGTIPANSTKGLASVIANTTFDVYSDIVLARVAGNANLPSGLILSAQITPNTTNSISFSIANVKATDVVVGPQSLLYKVT